MIFRRSLGCVLLGFVSCSLHAQAPASLPPDVIGKIEAAVPAALAATGIPSVEVGIVKDGQVVYTHAFGLARVSPKAEATPGMIYRIGSNSKQFTAAAVMLLAERGQLKLDDPVSTWFPELAHSREITLRMLLNQVSGYSDDYTEDYLTPEMAAPASTYAIVKEWTSHPLDFTPGTKWQYSNTNYGLAGLIVQKVAGEPFFKFLNENILRPAGITDAVDLDAADPPPLPVGYVEYGFAPMRPAKREGKGTLLGAGQLAMTVANLARWNTVVIGRKVLKPESWQTMQAEFILPDGHGTAYGMGFELGARDGKRVIYHGGEVEGFVSLNEIYPEQGIAITLLTNAESGTGALRKAVETPLFAPVAAAAVARNPAAEALVKTVIGDLEEGRIDRSRITPNLDFYFTPETLADYKTSLAPAGDVKTLEPLENSERGGMTGIFYKVQATGMTFGVFVYVMPDGKLDQFLLEKMN
jgi:CubicO group peptidase (beta-lactamase class C family)